MSVRIIYGAIGSGKSRMCLDEIEKKHSENPSARCIMIVPDHYSYEMEKSFVERFGGTGLNNIEVLTLRRMAINYLSFAELDHLSGAGRQMLIYKAVTSACEELRAREDIDKRLISSMSRQGFLEVASSLISELKRYVISPEELCEKAESVTDNKTLKNKLTALSEVYDRYLEYVAKSGKTDGEDDLNMLARRIEEGCGFDDNTYVWINRFDTLMPQQIRVLEALLARGVHMTISICYSAEAEEREIYSETEKTAAAAFSLADIYGFDGDKKAGKGLEYLKNKPDLYALLSMWRDDFVYSYKPENMSVFQSRDTYSEVEHTARIITDLAREGGYRFSDIAVLCGDEDEYSHLIEAVFTEYNIPYFSDNKISLSDHPIAVQLLSVFDIFDEDWSYEAVFRYLRAGFIYCRTDGGIRAINQGMIDELENFVLRCGIRGSRRWLDEEKWQDKYDIVSAAFGDEEDGSAFEEIDRLRLEIAAPIDKLAKSMRGKKTAREFAAALFEYLEDINLYAGLRLEIYKFNKNGMVNEAEQFTRIWNLILDVLNQATAAFPDDKMTAEEFASYISVGLAMCEIRTIPSGIDQVYVGSAERISRARVKAMFLIGMKNGTFPAPVKIEGFLSNNDRNTMSDTLGITIAPDTKKKTDEQYFKVYRALCTVTDRLYMSWSIQNEEGKPQNPSHLLLDILRKFPKIEATDNLSADEELFISSPRATMHKLIINLSERRDGKKNPLWDIVYDWYRDKEEWRRALSLLDKADYFSRRPIRLDGEISAELYGGKISYSPSRVNTFASCPFEYFLKYGLGAREREEWEITPANMGSYAHRVINEFCMKVENGAESGQDKINAWRKLDEEKRGKIISDIVDSTCENLLSSNMRDKEKTVSILRRMGKTISDAAALVHKSLSGGGFYENGMELNFDTEISDNMSLRGIIDRIDLCETGDGGKYLRIIDYKTGKTGFDVVNIANGYEMQMVIYAIAAKEFMREQGIDADVAGIYYTAVRSAYKKLNTKVTEDNIKEKNEEAMSLDGVTFISGDDEKRRALLENIDRDFFVNNESKFSGLEFDPKTNLLSGAYSGEQVEGLMASVRETLENIDTASREGKIGLEPYIPSTSREGVCAYCPYSSVCRFDDRCKTPREPVGTTEIIWNELQKKGESIKGVTSDAELD